MVGMAVAQDYGLDIGDIYFHRIHVVQYAGAAYTGIEEDGSLFITSLDFNQGGETVLGYGQGILERIWPQRKAFNYV
jgi:hypothetical protein